MTPELNAFALKSTARRATVVTLVLAFASAVAVLLVRGQLVVLTLFGAIVIGEAMRPLVNRLGARMPRNVAVALAFAAVLGVVAVLWLVPIRALIPQALTLAGKLREFSALLPPLNSPVLGPLAEGFLRFQTSIGSGFSTLGLMFVMAAFWLGASAALTPFLLSLAPPEQRSGLSVLCREIGDKLGFYVISTVVNGGLVAVECTAVLILLHAPYPVVLGLLQGLLIALPYLGTLIGVLAVGVVVLTTSGWVAAAVAMLAVGLAQSLQGTFIAPLIFKKGLDIDPLFTVVAIAIGGALFGIFGVVLAVPAASVLQTLVVRVAAPAIRSSYASPLPQKAS